MNDGNVATRSILLIEDEPAQMEKRLAALSEAVAGTHFSIDSWLPRQEETDYEQALERRLETRPILVATDHALDAGGAHGFRSGAVVSACRKMAIPVGNYSRKPIDLEEPDLFLFRFSEDPEVAAGEILDIASGFDDLATRISQEATAARKGWARTLADVLGRGDMAASFSLYSARNVGSFATTIKALEDRLGEAEAIRSLEIYMIGHLLKNGILSFAGPIMDGLTLCSYLACADEQQQELEALFQKARYEGPFGGRAAYFWQDDIDELLEGLAEEHSVEEEDGDTGDDIYRRKIVDAALGAKPHGCQRENCAGSRGGFRCPYTGRTVCDRPDCSATSSSWIPTGAHLCRVEREYYDRHAPLLGL